MLENSLKEFQKNFWKGLPKECSSKFERNVRKIYESIPTFFLFEYFAENYFRNLFLNFFGNFPENYFRNSFLNSFENLEILNFACSNNLQRHCNLKNNRRRYLKMDLPNQVAKEFSKGFSRENSKKFSKKLVEKFPKLPQKLSLRSF